MYELNLKRLMDACCVTIEHECFDELQDYLTERRVDLNTLNIDNLWVNGCCFIPKGEEVDSGVVFHTTDDGVYTVNMGWA